MEPFDRHMESIRGLSVPRLLIELMEWGRWQHPGEEVIRRVVPMITDPLVFLPSLEAMEFESRTFIADDPELSQLFHEYRGNAATECPDLPWLDIDRAFFIAVNKIPGDDVAIALDYRRNSVNPRVVAGEWLDDGCLWREVALTFSEFACLIGF